MSDDELLIEQANELICFPQPPMTKLHESDLRGFFSSFVNLLTEISQKFISGKESDGKDYVTLRSFKRESSEEESTIELKPVPKVSFLEK